MRITIIGAGTVGVATGDGFQRFGNEVVFYDTDPQKLNKLRLEGYDSITSLSDKPPDAFFICTPEYVVEDVVHDLPGKDTLIVIRSSVLPGTTKRLREATESRHIAVNPEFVREATATQDFLNPSRILYSACCHSHQELLEKLYEPFRAPMVHVDDPTVAEMVKYAANLFLATTVSYWNEIDNICCKLGINSHVVGKIAAMDPRIPSYGASQHGKPFGGKCLPHNLDAFIHFCNDLDYAPTLLEAVERINENSKASFGGKHQQD